AAGGGFPSVDFGRASALPAACGLSISFTIAPNMDCDQYVPLPPDQLIPTPNSIQLTRVLRTLALSQGYGGAESVSKSTSVCVLS
uniref:Uncharacterized protein n=1 Tax=Oryza brachyantha TaxID=4533 RepID=J3KXQ4_ORYBR